MTDMTKITFEEGIEKLENVVTRLENGDLPLDESFKAFEEGTKLAKTLKKMLDDGDKRIRELTDDGIKPFGEDEDAEA